MCACSKGRGAGKRNRKNKCSTYICTWWVVTRVLPSILPFGCLYVCEQVKLYLLLLFWGESEWRARTV